MEVRVEDVIKLIKVLPSIAELIVVIQRLTTDSVEVVNQFPYERMPIRPLFQDIIGNGRLWWITSPGTQLPCGLAGKIGK